MEEKELEREKTCGEGAVERGAGEQETGQEAKPEETAQKAAESREEEKQAAGAAGEAGGAETAGVEGQSGVSGQEEAGSGADKEAAGEKEPEKAAESAKNEKSEKRGFFGKKKDPRDTQIEELTDRLRRTMAEFDNFRKRTEKEKASMYEIGARDIIEKILPVVDNLERGLSAVPEDVKGTPFAEGMEKIYKQMVKTLDDLDVKPIEAVGKEFDPNLHNAVMHVDDENLGENVVAAELQKGYTYRGTVVRHSMVQVAN